jgi:hypothetical protein
VLHKNEEVPPAVNVTEFPAQMLAEEGVQVTVGRARTVTVDEAVFEQPNRSVPVTEYVVVADGLAVMLAVVAPVFHRKLLAPLAVSVAEAPAQTVAEEGVQTTTGNAFTVSRHIFEVALPHEFVIKHR